MQAYTNTNIEADAHTHTHTHTVICSPTLTLDTHTHMHAYTDTNKEADAHTQTYTQIHTYCDMLTNPNPHTQTHTQTHTHTHTGTDRQADNKLILYSHRWSAGSPEYPSVVPSSNGGPSVNSLTSRKHNPHTTLACHPLMRRPQWKMSSSRIQNPYSSR